MADGPEKKAAKKAAKKATSAKKAAPAKKAGGAKKAAPAKKRASSSKAAPAGKRKPEHGEIAERAYHIHEREGGDAVQNWLRAERELSGD